MKIFDVYLLKNLTVATLFIATILTFIVFLTQSLRFLEIIINSGTSGTAFWTLTILALPRFFEIILPLSLVAGTLFIYNKMTMDSELTIMRAIGHSPLHLARPALALSIATMILLWATTMWIAPATIAKMQELRTKITSEFSNYLFREGVFNTLGSGLTFYIHNRTDQNEMAGLMIHDTRTPDAPPSTILAKRGVVVMTNVGQQIVVFNGTRQEYNPSTGVLQRLNFDQYTIDLPENNPAGQRWSEPDERTMFELLNPDMRNSEDRERLRDFAVELHRRFTSPLLALSLPLIALNALLLGAVDRRGQIGRIIVTAAGVVLIQGFYITAYNLARNSDTGLVLMYLLTLLPIAVSFLFLSDKSEKIRGQLIRKVRTWAFQ
jgi:lipopolysaccharide export system permease protein